MKTNAEIVGHQHGAAEQELHERVREVVNSDDPLKAYREAPPEVKQRVDRVAAWASFFGF